MFLERAPTWDDILKTGQIVPLFKKGAKDDVNNYRVVCLLAMRSRILAKIMSKRLREWAEHLQVLDENQSGFRAGRSTADATQILVRITEDTNDLKNKEPYVTNQQISPQTPKLDCLTFVKRILELVNPLYERSYGVMG